jgi:hypothetical protein
MNLRLANSISVIFHPLLMPTWVFFIFFYLCPSVVGVDAILPARPYLLGFICATTFFLPALFTYYLYRFGYAKDLTLSQLSDRRLPYLGTILLYGLAIYFFGFKFEPISNIAPQIALILASITVSIIIIALISLRWQISAHGAGIGGALGFIGAVYLKNNEDSLWLVLALAIVATGAVLSARLRLNAHTPAQAWAGVCIGLIINSLTVFIYF